MQTKDYCAWRHGLTVSGAVGGATYFGRAIDCRPFRQAQSFVHVVRQASVAGGAETLDFGWQSSPLPARHPDSYMYDGTDDGNTQMATGAATDLALSTQFTTVGACQIHTISFWLHRNGTPALAGGGIPNVQAEIFTNAAGVPGAAVMAGNFAMIPTASIPTGITKVTFTLPLPCDLTAATIYHAVITANYDVSGANNIAVHQNTVLAGAQRSDELDAAWGASALKNYWAELMFLNFAAEAAGVIPDVAHTQVLDDIIADAHERREINVTELTRGPYIRPFITVGAGAVVWNLAKIFAIMSDPLVLPTADLWDAP